MLWYKNILRKFPEDLRSEEHRLLRKTALLAFFSAFFLSIIFFVPGFCSSAVLLDRVVAVVNKEVITWSELYKMMESEASEQVKSLSDQERVKVFKENEALFLEKLIDFRLQIQEARRLGIDVSHREVAEAVENIRKKYSLSEETLRESLKQEGLSFEEYKTRLGEQLLLSQVINQQIRNKVVVSDEEISKYIQANKQLLNEGETFRIRQIFFKKPQDESGKKGIEEKSLIVMQRLKAGEDFAVLAREYSEDPSASQGGDLGHIRKDLMAKEFIDRLKEIKQGEFSEPFWSDRGLHILRLDEKKDIRKPDELRDDVRKQLAEKRFREKYSSWIKGLRENARIEVRL